ncbi:hypothetical protein [Amphritea japonica]|uniref:Transmembrane protein n=1 Tax=Amphritea japonica ATCC BAA-1530 TaxID=1278309 RepID=A0A7R6PDJ5_9GAMM|nr:hypothetical protein [Amphritea japonica]BBB26141.1 conserved hypothetical protein [Amphritea japonica ATCC BAA-1530]
MLQNFLFLLIVSLPVVGFISMCRSFLCAYRSYKASKVIQVIICAAFVFIMLAVLAFDLVVLFGYGVAHTGKNSTNDFIVLMVTVIPTYAAAYGLWLICRYMEKPVFN